MTNSDINRHRLNWADVEHLVDQITSQIIASNWQPDIIIALSRSGFVPATMLAYRLQVTTLAGLDVRKDDSGIRSAGYIVKLQDLAHQKVLVVDDGIISGRLLTVVPEEVRARGGEPKTCALVSEGQSSDPDYLATTSNPIPRFPWEQD